MRPLTLQNRIVLWALFLVLIPILVFLWADRNRDQSQYRQALLFQGRDAANAVVALQSEAQENFMGWLQGVRDELEDQQWFIRTGAVRPEIRIRTLSDLSGYDGLNIQGYREGQSRPLFRLGPQSRTITTIVQRVRRSDIFGREVLLVFDEGRPYWVASAAAQVGEQTIELLATIDATSQYSRIGALVDSSLYLVAGENKVPPFTLYELEPHAGFFDAGLQAGMQDVISTGPDLIFSQEINPNLDAFMVLKRDSCVRRYLQKYFSLSSLCGQVLTLKDLTAQRAEQKRQEQVLLSIFGFMLVGSLILFVGLIYFEFWPLRRLAALLGARVQTTAQQSDDQTRVLAQLKKVQARVPGLAEGLDTRDSLQRYRDELAFATVTQAGILPPADAGKGAFEGRLIPAREVAGDFYDVIDLPNNRLGIVVADVSDKGVAPALFGARAASLMRGLAAVTDSPSALLEQLNRNLMERNPENLFITLAYFELDLKTRQVRQANAGHETPLLLSFDRDGRLKAAREDEAHPSLPLALSEEADWPTVHRSLPPGEALLVFTDGITEIEKAGEEFLGADGLVAMVNELIGTPKADLLNRLEDRLIELRQGKASFDDDITLALVG